MNYKLVPLKTIGDERGKLISLESHKNLPFAIKRVYYMFDTLPDLPRGFHAHKELEQLVIAIDGACEFVLDDGKSKESLFILGQYDQMVALVGLVPHVALAVAGYIHLAAENGLYLLVFVELLVNLCHIVGKLLDAEHVAVICKSEATHSVGDGLVDKTLDGSLTVKERVF